MTDVVSQPSFEGREGSSEAEERKDGASGMGDGQSKETEAGDGNAPSPTPSPDL